MQQFFSHVLPTFVTKCPSCMTCETNLLPSHLIYALPRKFLGLVLFWLYTRLINLVWFEPFQNSPHIFILDKRVGTEGCKLPQWFIYPMLSFIPVIEDPLIGTCQRLVQIPHEVKLCFHGYALPIMEIPAGKPLSTCMHSQLYHAFLKAGQEHALIPLKDTFT